MVPSLLIPLASPHRLIRERALDCLQALKEACHPSAQSSDLQDDTQDTAQDTTVPPPSQDPANTANSRHTSTLHLVHALLEFQIEIATDHTQINQILSKLYIADSAMISPSLVPPPTPSKRRKSRRLEATEGGSGVRGPQGMDWLECVLHTMSLGMPIFVQYQFLKVLGAVDHVVSRWDTGCGIGCNGPHG